MNRQALLENLHQLKNYTGTDGTAFQYMGRSVHDKIATILKNDKNIVTHFHIPKGDGQATKNMKEQHLDTFGTMIDNEILSFFTCFDGFELRYVDLDDAWQRFTFVDQGYVFGLGGPDVLFDWQGNNIDPAGLTIEDLKKEKHELVLDEFLGIFGLTDLFAGEQDIKRLSDPNKKGILYYSESVDYEDFGIKTFMPPAALFLDPENKVNDSNLYYLNFHHSFNQLAYGKKDGKQSLFHVEDAGASASIEREDFRIHMKKNLIRKP